MKKFLAILLSVLTMFSALSMIACDNKKEDESSAPQTNFVFNGFEEFEKDILTMRVVDFSFGSVNINRDKKYVKFGESSAVFRPCGSLHGTGKPIIYLPTYSARWEYSYKDMSKVEKISAWFYNAQEESFRVGLGLQTKTISCNQTLDATSRTVAKSFDLAPGWNYVEYDLDPKFLKCTTNLDITNIFGIFIQFEYVDQFRTTEAERPYIYCDDMRFHLSETTVEGSDTFGLKADAANNVWEIADFEDPRQLQFFSLTTDIVETRRPTLEVVNANEVSTTAKSGTNVLKVTHRSSYTTSHSQGLTLSRYVFEEVFKTIGQDLIDHPENYELVIDYYNAAPVQKRCGYNVGSTACNKVGPSWRYLDYCQPYQWAEWRMNIGWADSWIEQCITQEDKPHTYPSLLEGRTLDEAKFSLNPASMSFTLSGLAVEELDQIFVFDNIRVEKIA